MFKIRNKSKLTVGLLLEKEDGGLYQFNLAPDKTIRVAKLTEQMEGLADPAKGSLRITREE